MKKNNRNGDFSRPKSSAIEIAGTTLLLCALLITVESGMAFDLPRVIGEFSYDYPPADFTAIGDQNGDGKDDLLVSSSIGGGDNRFEVFIGNIEMSEEPDWLIPAFRQNEVVSAVWFLGHLIPGNSICFVTKSTLRNQNEDVILTDFHSGFSMGEDSLIDSWVTRLRQNSRVWNDGQFLRPFDFNNDGFNEICMRREVSSTINAIDVYYGGESFDSIPDWTKYYVPGGRNWRDGNFSFSIGNDLNADGYDDILIRSDVINDTIPQRFFYELFLGGADPDTIPVFRLWDESIQRRDNGDFVNMNYGFTMLPDVNADGYDDFAIYFSEWIQQQNASVDGVFIFFGGEEIDAQPDMALEGSHAVGDPEEGWITTGDFNGDGIGDVVVSYWQRPPLDNGEVNYHFGGAEFDTIPDVVVNHRDYNRIYPHLGQEIGGVGDYNGDGADDVVARVLGDGERNVDLVILAGSRAWDLSVLTPAPPIPTKSSIVAYPNPFNSFVTLRYELISTSKIQLEAYDVSGRLIEVMVDGWQDSGAHSVDWHAGSGIFFISLVAGTRDGQSKKIVRKVVCLQ